ncbi:SusC/RagA family TonB-linked outer membrane protein [Marivirga lumbricoides]|uniref:SusC/RagA family TonB-linked outer membrane protein n=2 Tax=Marivirga lumbricoides TaxID=1046115 RepID=A0ABQ1MIF3_9BACT|nr:SusC/RagA family TonB-linked outer membrane protein [Marivirga lumbricoides]
MLAFVLQSWAQNRTVSGKVTDENGEGLPGVNVLIKGTGEGAISDLNGDYRLEVSQSDGVLIFSFIGYANEEVEIGAKSVIDVSMMPDIRQLGEVVVVGYGTQERRELTGSVTSVSGESISNLVTPSFDQQLGGRAPGVQVTTPSGILGQAPQIRIRGVNSITGSADPLIVIDGVPVVNSDRSAIAASNPLSNINPADIESFEVLKDGSATAIYGSRAANGVILITTKRGSKGAAKVNYSMSYGVNEEVNRFDLLSGDEFVVIANEKRTNAGASSLANEGENSDWQDYIFRKGLVQQHNISVSGGSDNTKYYFSLGFSDQESAVKQNDLTRYSFRANIDHSILDRLRIGTSLSYSLTETRGLNVGANSLSGVIYNATRALPNVAIFDADNVAFDGFNVTPNGASLGQGANNATVDNNIPNIGFVLENNIFRNRAHRVLGNLYGEIDILKDLTARTQIGVDVTLPDDFRSWDPRHGDGRGSVGSVYQQFAPVYRWNWQNTLNYQTIFLENHRLNVTAGVEYQYTNFYNFFGQGTGISDRFFQQENLISNSFQNQFSGGGFSEQGFDSYFARVNYSIGGKYLLSAAIRNDGISSLPSANRRGTFPGASIGWRISDENFFNNDGLFKDLKIRASYAEVGNTEIGLFPYVGGFGPVLNGAGPGIAYAQVANQNLLWESSAKTNFGIDLIVGGVTINADYFINDIDNLVLARPTAPSLGVPNNEISENIGAMTNKGVELRLSSTVIQTGNFSWNTDFNFTWIKNEVTNLNAPIQTTYNRTEVGQPIASLYGFQWAGVNSANGNPMYYKNDGSIVQYNLVQGQTGWKTYNEGNPADVSTAAQALGSDDQAFLGNTLPVWQGGWINTLNYNNFTFELFLRYSGGNYIMNESQRGLLGQGFSNNDASILNRWTEGGQVTDIPKLYSGQDANMWQTSASNSRFVEKGDFLRVQNVVLGYNVPNQVLNTAFKGNIKSVRIFAQVQNPITITGYSGLDPELNNLSAANASLQFGVDWNVAPIIRTWSAGLNIGF